MRLLQLGLLHALLGLTHLLVLLLRQPLALLPVIIFRFFPDSSRHFASAPLSEAADCRLRRTVVRVPVQAKERPG